MITLVSIISVGPYYAISQYILTRGKLRGLSSLITNRDVSLVKVVLILAAYDLGSKWYQISVCSLKSQKISHVLSPDIRLLPVFFGRILSDIRFCLPVLISLFFSLMRMKSRLFIIIGKAARKPCRRACQIEFFSVVSSVFTVRYRRRAQMSENVLSVARHLRKNSC